MAQAQDTKTSNLALHEPIRVQTVQAIDITAIDVEPQIRTRNGFDDESIRSLAESIIRNGLLQPIIVTAQRIENAGPNAAPMDEARDRYRVIAGHRRLAAMKVAGYTHAPALVQVDSDLQVGFEAQLAENIQREALTLADTADAVRMLARIHDKPADVAAIVHKSTAWVSKHLALTDPKFSPEVRELLDTGLCDDLESLHGLHQIAKHKDGATSLARLIKAIKKDGSVRRSEVRDVLARLKAPRDLEVERVKSSNGPAETVYRVQVDPQYIETFEELGGRDWLHDLLEKQFKKTAH